MGAVKNLQIQKFGNCQMNQKKVFSIIQTTSLSKDFALKDQINKSVGSIPDNIAEGFGRGDDWNLFNS